MLELIYIKAVTVNNIAIGITLVKVDRILKYKRNYICKKIAY